VRRGEGGVIDRAAASLRLRAADAADALRGRTDALTPPRRLRDFVGDSDFQATGEEFLGYFRALAGLQSHDRVLDVGCGIGRMARVLVPVLEPPGSYDGFDIVARGITWCRLHYVDTPVPFRFHHADLRNAAYNPGGAQAAVDYRFPFADGSFDLVVATSLFTHVLAGVADRYLAEAARVLATGGRLFSTWMLLTADDRNGPLPRGLSRTAPAAPTAVGDPAVPEAMVAYDESWLRQVADAHRLRVETIRRGSWPGRSATNYQDLVLAYRS
jgi:SAM-dependent methyltransferase